MELEMLRKVIAEVLNVDQAEITMDTTFVDDLGADSLDVFQIIMGIEEELDIEVNVEEAEKIVTVGDAVELIKKTVGSSNRMLDDKSPWFKGFCSVKEKKVKTIKEFQEVIGYEFENESLLRQALTHSSYANEKHMKKLSDNERLEFLGDAVLEAVSSEFLFLNYRDLPEGDLTRLRASMVCEPTLAYCTKEIDLGSYIYLGKGEDMACCAAARGCGA